MPRFVDISMPLENDVVSDPAPFGPKITYVDHAMSVERMTSFFPGLQGSDLRDGEGWAIEKVELITHNGTHLDALERVPFRSSRTEGVNPLDMIDVDRIHVPGRTHP